MDICTCTELLCPGAEFNPGYVENRDRPDFWRDKQGRKSPADADLLFASEKFEEWKIQQKSNEEALEYLSTNDWKRSRHTRELSLITSGDLGETSLTNEQYASFEKNCQELAKSIVSQSLEELGTEIRNSL